MIWIQKAKYRSQIIDEEWMCGSRKWAFFYWNILFLVACLDDTCPYHPTGVSRGLAVLRPHFNFPLFSGKNKWASQSLLRPYCTFTMLWTPLSSPTDPVCRRRLQSSPFWRQWKPLPWLAKERNQPWNTEAVKVKAQMWRPATVFLWLCWAAVGGRKEILGGGFLGDLL